MPAAWVSFAKQDLQLVGEPVVLAARRHVQQLAHAVGDFLGRDHVVGGIGRGEEGPGDEAQAPAVVLVGQQQEDARAFGRGVLVASSSPNTGIAAKAALPVCCT
jgi:hypothetical protein